MTALHVRAGEDLLPSLMRVAGDVAWVQAAGTIESVQLRLTARHPTVTLPSGALALLSLVGSAAGPFMATIAVEGKSGGIEVIGGELLRARSLGVHGFAFRLAPPGAPFGDAHARALDDAPATTARIVEGPAQGRESVLAGEVGPASKAESSWATIARAAAAEHAPQEEEATEMPRQKDRVDHFKFGLCDVIVVHGDNLKIRDVKGPARLREIRLDMLKVLAPVERDGKRVFKLTRRS